MTYRILLFLSIFFTLQNFAQQRYPQQYFNKPFDLPLILAGNFGELRNNHFHSGLDIKTGNKEGVKIKSVADGYISRIKVSIWGYGKALYITHPNGYTSVYAHLNKFSPKIESFVKNKQYKKKSYEIQLFLKKDDMKVDKDQIVAYSGNTGSSSAPHLHFELRNTANEKPINPLLFGYHVSDHIKPIISKLVAYPLNDTSHVNQSNKPVTIRYKTLKNGDYLADNILAFGSIGFGVITYDRQDAALNRNGNYELSLTQNDSIKYHSKLNEFSFENTKDINLFLDYESYAKENEYIQKCFIVPKNNLKIYDESLGTGALLIKDSLKYHISIKSKDFENNTVQIRFNINGKKDQILIRRDLVKTNYFVKSSINNKFEIKNVSVVFLENTFSDDFYLDFKVEDDIAFIDKDIQALDKNFTLTFKIDTLNYPDFSKLYIANIISSKKSNYISTQIKGDEISASLRTLGAYGIKTDQSKPIIRPVNFKNGQWLTNYHFLKVSISDSDSGIKSYNGYIDDEWILMEYEPKKEELTYHLSDKTFDTTKHIFKLVVSDNVGNTTVYSANFFRKK